MGDIESTVNEIRPSEISTNAGPPTPNESHVVLVKGKDPLEATTSDAITSDHPRDTPIPKTTPKTTPKTLATTRPDVFRLIKEYISQNGGTAGGAVAVEALTQEIENIEPNLAFQVFCDIVLKVNKTLIGTPDDPTGSIFKVAVEKAPKPQFWAMVTDPTNSEYLINLLNRCRNWISVMARQENFAETVSALGLIEQLPLTSDLLNNVNLPCVIKRLGVQTDNESVHNTIKKLTSKYPEAFATKNSALSSKVTSMKLFGDDGALKLRSHKRQRVPSPPPASTNDITDTADGFVPAEPTSSQTDLDEPATARNGDIPEAPLAKRRCKKLKRVSWKPDNDLVQVKYFEMEGTVKFRSAKNAKQQEFEEGFAMHQVPTVEWRTPKVIDFDEIFGKDRRIQELMSSRRGGLKEPQSEESQIQEQRESRIPGGLYMSASGASAESSPKEPPESETRPESSWTPRQGGKFAAVEPSPEWAQKNEKATPNNTVSATMPMGITPPITPPPGGIPNLNGMPNMGSLPGGASPMMAMPMPGFPWGFPMNMNMNMGMAMNMNPMGMTMTPNQMSEMRDRQNKPFSRQS